MNNLILVTNWEKVDKDDFYLSSDWEKQEDKDNIERGKALQKDGNLYIAYIVDAKNYALYSQMDADQVFVNGDGDVILHCETAIIDNRHSYRQEMDY